MEIFGLESDNPGEVVLALADLLKIPDQIRDAIRLNPAVPDALLGLLPDAERYLESLLGGLSNQGLAIAQESVFAQLLVISDQLSRLAPESMLDRVELDGIRESVTSLIEEIRTSTVDRVLADFLLDELLSIQHAIDRFDLLGEAPLRDAFSKFVGDSRLLNQPVGEEDDSDSANDIREKFSSIMNRVYQILVFGANATQITAFVTEAIGAGHIHL